MSKEIRSGIKFIKEVFDGADEAAQIIASSLGPEGGCVFLSNQVITKDGATIAKALNNNSNPVAAKGWSLVSEASNKMAAVTGDGSTTVVVLLINVMKECLNLLQAGYSSRQLCEAIDFGVNKLTGYMSKFTKPISTVNDIKNIALVASNHDEEIAEYVAKAFKETNNIGRIVIETSPKNTFLEILPGFYIDRGLQSRHFLKQGEEASVQKIDLKDANVLVTDKTIDMSFYTDAIKSEFINKLVSSPLLIIADDFSPEMLQFFAANRSLGRLNVVCVKAPGFGDKKLDSLEDIAIATNAQIIYKDRDNWDKLSRWDEVVGKAKLVKISMKDTLIIDGAGGKDAIDTRLSDIKNKIKATNSNYDKEKLEERLGNLQGGICVLYLQASTESEQTERQHRGDDTIRASREAHEHGIVPGGGIDFLYLRHLFLKEKTNNEIELLSHKIFARALSKVFVKILENSGIENYSVIINEVEQELEKGNYDYGFDVINKQTCRFMDAGIINPSSIATGSLDIVKSIGKLFIKLKGGIIEIQDNKNESANIPSYD